MPDDDLTFYTRRAYQEGQAAATSAANAELREALRMSANEATSPAEWARHVVRLLDGTTARADAAESAVRKLRARAADVLGEPLDTSDAGGLSQVERAIQVGEAAAFRGTLITEWSTKAERVRQSFMSLADDVSNDALGGVLNAHAVACDIRALAAEIPSESETTTAARLREAANAEAARQVARCAAELGYVGEPATLAVAVGDACLAFACELREIHARHAVTVKRLEAEVDALKLAQVARDAEVKS